MNGMGCKILLLNIHDIKHVHDNEHIDKILTTIMTFMILMILMTMDDINEINDSQDFHDIHDIHDTFMILAFMTNHVHKGGSQRGLQGEL